MLASKGDKYISKTHTEEHSPHSHERKKSKDTISPLHSNRTKEALFRTRSADREYSNKQIKKSIALCSSLNTDITPVLFSSKGKKKGDEMAKE